MTWTRLPAAVTSSKERYGIARDQVRRDLDDWYNRQTW
ncbi:uncharacterized protein YjbJ (UPF0337 family) [Sinorhizobium kostiense]|uniref:Uncharacterized protein YjbJ (UPF0337 family) n=1 Tax=Sinorhizobium kostiense TaxID=76747 RepID=A0ABS4R7B1_9HYPH|nr:uncharacterized protein YjbJ (UPF0337 family) [Sinorhizobium kostiense]